MSPRRAPVAVVDAQRADDAAQRPPLFEQASRALSGRELDRGQGERRHLPRRRGFLRQPAEPDPHHGAPERRRRGDDRERDRQQRPAGDEQRVGDRRRHGQRQQAERATRRAGCAARAAAPPATTAPDGRRAPARPSRPSGRPAAAPRNSVCANHMIGASSRKKIVSVTTPATKRKPPPKAAPQRRPRQHVDHGRDLRREPHHQHEAEQQRGRRRGG